MIYHLFSAAQAYRNKLSRCNIYQAPIGMELMELKKLPNLAGLTIVQDPADCEVKTMTEAALQLIKANYVLSSDKITNFLSKLK